jgi:hypothetical protein
VSPFRVQTATWPADNPKSGLPPKAPDQKGKSPLAQVTFALPSNADILGQARHVPKVRQKLSRRVGRVNEVGCRHSLSTASLQKGVGSDAPGRVP